MAHSNSNGDDTGNRILIDVPGFARSEIRATLAAGDLLVRAEKNVTKGKGKENAFDDPLLPVKPLDEKVELPLGIKVRIFSCPKPFSPLTVAADFHYVACRYSCQA